MNLAIITILRRVSACCYKLPHQPSQFHPVRAHSIRPPEMDDPHFQKLRVRKRLFAWVLGMVTLGTAWVLKSRKRSKLAEYLEDSALIFSDHNYASKMQFFVHKDCVLPESIIKSGIMKMVEKFEGRDTDIIVASFPKCGTTWVQELVYLMSTGLDFVTAKAHVLETRFPYLEFPYPGIKTISLKSMSEQRFIKTHLPYWLLPDSIKTSDAKIIYVTRNPKDVCVSYYHFLRMLSHFSYVGSFAEFVESFIMEKAPYSPFFSHALSYWEKKNDPRILFIFFEDLVSDPQKCINQISSFLGKAISAEEVRLLVTHTSFANMAQNSSVNYSHWKDLGLTNKGETVFMRKGQVGDWTNYFTDDLNVKMDNWISSRLEGSDLSYKYLPLRSSP